MMFLPRQLCTYVACAFAAGFWCAAAAAGPIQPFEAVVQAAPGEDVYARSGPGKERFYPTLKLANGQKVTVRRKDPGGWFMIDPPEGSFSWFPAEYVQRNGNQGTVTENAIVVRVGAFNSNQRDVEQVRLNRGDTVEIIKEESIDTQKGGKTVKESWYRIKPPPGEYRWVKGSSLAQLNPDGSTVLVTPVPGSKEKVGGDSKNDLVQTPKKKKGGDEHTPAVPVDPGENDAPPFEGDPKGKSIPPVDDADLGPSVVLGNGSRGTDQTAIRRQLLAISDQMREIRKSPEIQWDLSGVEAELMALQQFANGTSLQPFVEQRIRELRRDQMIHQNAVEFAIREQRPPTLTQRLPNRPVNQNGVPLDPRSGVLGAVPPGTMSPRNGTPAGLTSPALNGVPNAGATPGGSRFQGAGIVARVRNPVPDVPRYVLIRPNGQLLCYLETQSGLNLEPYVGKAMGLNGQRGFDERLRADRMRVQQLTPIQLSQ